MNSERAIVHMDLDTFFVYNEVAAYIQRELEEE